MSFTSGGRPTRSPLQTLNLDNNSLTTLDVSGHPALVWLSVANNKLGSIALNADTYLQVLNASHNQLTSFDLPIQTVLTFADLSHNILSDIDQTNPKPDLGQLVNLSYLDLSRNNLTTIGSISAIAFTQTNNNQLRSLFLACNPKFQCGDLGVYNGSKYPAASTSQCSAYDTSKSEWTPLTNPTCPPG